MRSIQKFLGLAALLGMTLRPLAAADTVSLNGAGATFPYPIYSKWFDEYHKIHSNIEINYQSIGSGGGNFGFRLIGTGAGNGESSEGSGGTKNGELVHEMGNRVIGWMNVWGPRVAFSLLQGPDCGCDADEPQERRQVERRTGRRTRCNARGHATADRRGRRARSRPARQSPICRAMIISCTSVVPSPISRILLSR